MENQIILEFVVSERKQVEEINKGNFVLKDVRLKFTSEEWLEVPDEIRQIILSDSHFRREKMEFQLRYSLDAIGKDQAIECLQDIHQKRVDKANFDEEFKKFEIKMVKELEGLKNDFKLEDIRFYEFPDIVFVTIQKDTIRVDTNISAGEYLKFEGYLPRLSELISEKISEKEEAEKIALEEKITLDTAKLAMKNWALQNGSDLLKARIEEDMNWISLAESEYLKLNFPLLEKWQVIYTNNDEAKNHGRLITQLWLK
ncbi:hypothetical protein ACFFJX_02400 [Pseudarcicella hirudinis]|uniref:hypothetical protein n=1 Tax=Pseudarcicella hirudinis TaxID=1079859 RepID=UPI0035E50D4F